MTARSKVSIYLILMLSTIGLVATDIYLPSFPSIQASFSSTKALVQLSLSLYLLSYSLSQVFYGPLSDRFGRRKLALIGLSIGLIGTMFCIFSTSISFLIFGRFFQGFGLAAGAALARAIMRDAYEGDRLAHVASLTTVGSSILMAMAPTLGGYLELYLGWRSNFLFLLIYTIVILLSIWRLLPETNKEFNLDAIKIKVFVGHYLHLITNPIFMGYSCCSSLSFAGMSAYFASSPFLFEQILGLSAVEYGWLAFIFAFGLGLGGFFNVYMIPHFGRDRMLIVGIAILFSSGCFMLLPALLGWINVFVIMAPVFIYTFGSAITLSNSFAGAFHPFAKIAGFAGALYGSLQVLGGALAAAIVAFITEKNQIPLSSIFIVIGLSAYFFQLLAVRASHKSHRY